MKKNNIKVIIWDKILIKLNEYDPTKWLIIKRL